jgi:hypothetical protein
MTMATIVDTTALLRTVLAALASGIGATLIVSVALLGAVRSLEYGREGRSMAAATMGALAALALLAVAAAVTIGIIVMTDK